VFSCGLALVQAWLTGQDLSDGSPLAPVAWLASLAVGAFWLGSLGTERIWYLRAFHDEPMTPAMVWLLSWRYMGRFLRFGLLLAWRFAVLLLLAVGLFVLARRAGGALPWWYYAGTLLCAIPVFAATTFAAPALTYATRNPGEAIHIGWAIVRTFWPEAAAYVLLPPVLFILGQGRLGGAPLVLLGTLVNLLLKGTSASFFLRYRDVVDEALPKEAALC
jgi:hypothetical protein